MEMQMTRSRENNFKKEKQILRINTTLFHDLLYCYINQEIVVL